MKKKRELYIGGFPIKDYLPILFIFSIVWGMSIIVDAIGEHNHWGRFAFFYLGISFSLYFYTNAQDKENYKRQIARLNQEIIKLEQFKESDKLTIDLLKKELEQAQNTSQQE